MVAFPIDADTVKGDPPYGISEPGESVVHEYRGHTRSGEPVLLVPEQMFPTLDAMRLATRLETLARNARPLASDPTPPPGDWEPWLVETVWALAASWNRSHADDPVTSIDVNRIRFRAARFKENRILVEPVLQVNVP